MRSVFLLSIFLPIVGFAQNEPNNDSIRMTNGIVSMTEIYTQFKSDTISYCDTIFESQTYDKYGRLISEKYRMGTHVLHKYFYDANSLLIKEVRMTPPSSLKVLDKPTIYPDTMTIIDYHYENGRIAEADKVDHWGSFVCKTFYTYNSQGVLVSEIDKDSSGNIYDFRIHKIRSDAKLDYSVINHNQMTKDVSYHYDNGVLVKKNIYDDMYPIEVIYERGIATEHKRYSYKDLIEIGKYTYNDYGLLKKITLFEVKDGVKIKASEYNYMYNFK